MAMEDLEKYLTYDNKLLIFIRFKLREWAKILANKKITEKETEEIRGKLEQICDLMYGGHHKKLFGPHL